MLNKLSLKTKALTLAIAFGTLPLICSGGIVYYFAGKNVYNSKVKEEEMSAMSLSDKINRFLFQRCADIQAIANLPTFADPKVSAEITALNKQKIIDTYIKLYQVYNSIAVFDLKGDVIAQSSGKLLKNHSDRDYFQQVLKTGEPYISGVSISKSTGIVAVYFVAPVKDINTGKMIAIARSRMPLENLNRLTESITNTGQEWHIVDNVSGKFIAALEKDQIGNEVASDLAIFAQMDKDRVAHGITVDRLDGAKQLIAYAPLEKLEGMPKIPWGTIIAQDTKDVFAPQRQLMWIILLGTGITAVVTSGIAILLSNLITNFIQDIVNQIASSSSEIASTIEQQERTISQQAAEQAEASNQGTQKALTLTEDGSKVVQQTVAGMSALKEQVRAIAEQIMHLSEQTGQIAGISELVGDIANQTNMLALNAAVEAARAGEQGQGFGVVAGEIRKLADETKKSAEKINILVGDIQAAMNSTVMVTDQGTKKTEESIGLAQGTAETFVSVADAINSVFLNSQQISLSSKQQAIGVQQVVAAMNTLNLGARETAAGINQVQISAKQLDLVAQKLKAMV